MKDVVQSSLFFFFFSCPFHELSEGKGEPGSLLEPPCDLVPFSHFPSSAFGAESRGLPELCGKKADYSRRP